uniref:Uncharacterized protein n=1 Tax=Cacopsylla melanoneura TaxID=428564 RepID=A0A8D8PXB6_9HEMI
MLSLVQNGPRSVPPMINLPPHLLVIVKWSLKQDRQQAWARQIKAERKCSRRKLTTAGIKVVPGPGQRVARGSLLKIPKVQSQEQQRWLTREPLASQVVE